MLTKCFSSPLTSLFSSREFMLAASILGTINTRLIIIIVMVDSHKGIAQSVTRSISLQEIITYSNEFLSLFIAVHNDTEKKSRINVISCFFLSRIFFLLFHFIEHICASARPIEKTCWSISRRDFLCSNSSIFKSFTIIYSTAPHWPFFVLNQVKSIRGKNSLQVFFIISFPLYSGVLFFIQLNLFFNSLALWFCSRASERWRVVCTKWWPLCYGKPPEEANNKEQWDKASIVSENALSSEPESFN